MSLTTGDPDTRHGLTTAEAQARLQRYGPNAVPEPHPHAVVQFLRKLAGPVPWMLQATLVLQIVRGEYTQAVIILALLLLNAVLSFVQEDRARRALALLQQRLTVQARVLRDGVWRLLPAQQLVPGDQVHVRVGDFIPADLAVADGQVLLDQSALTGESAPVEAAPGAVAYAGSTVRRGEATGEVTATGQQTYFGKTSELVRTAHAPSHLETIVVAIVRYLVALDLVLISAVVVYALAGDIPLTRLAPFALVLLIASVPIALPATYTLATALGSLELARRGVLVTRLSAVEEAAAMDILCCDKTGTITRNELSVVAVYAYPPQTNDEVLRHAAMACDEATQDPIDLAILAAARARGLLAAAPLRLRFLPFDPGTKRSEAVIDAAGSPLRVVKGAPQVIAALAPGGPDPSAAVNDLAARGYRVLAVAAGPDDALRLLGLVALADPPRADSRAVVQDLADLGVRVVMVTGDGPATAAAVAAEVGIHGSVCPAGTLHAGTTPRPLECGIFAEVFPEDKFHLVQTMQRLGHVTGMTGDGVNDAPALKQAEVGVAVANATDVAKAAASLVLTDPGLGGVRAAVETGRRVYQRMLTYTLNKIIKTLQVALFLTFGLFLTGEFVTTPLLILLLLFANDFVTMSLAADRASFSRQPDRWPMRPLVLSALGLALGWLVFSFAVLLVGRDLLHLDLGRLQTLVFVMLVFTGQATVYLVRQRGRFWGMRPGGWLMLASAADLVIVSVLAAAGILMDAINPALIAGLLVFIIAYMFVLDGLKIWLFRRFELS